MKAEHKVIAISIVFGVLSWIIDALLDTFVFYNRPILELLITNVPPHELYVRLVIFAGFVAFGVLTSSMLGRQRRTEEALARERAELRATLYSIGDAVIATDDEKRVARMNPVAEQLTGWGEEEAINKPLDEVFHIVNEETREQVANPVPSVLRDGQTSSLANQTLLISRGGRETPISDAAAPIFDPEGKIGGVVLVFHDQAEERWAQRFVETRLSLIEYADNHSLDALLTRALDEIGAFVESPIGFYHFVEDDQKTLSLQQWSTRTLKEFCEAEGRGAHYGIDQAGVWVDCVHARKPVIHNDYASLPHKKGLPEGHAPVIRELVVPVMREDRVVAILGVGNKPTEYTERDAEVVSYFADVTWEIVQQKRAQEALQEYAEQLEEMVAAKVRELDKERSKVAHAGRLASLGEMATGVAHELNQPLAAILFEANYLRSLAQSTLAIQSSELTIDVDIMAEIAEGIAGDVARCSRIINHLREFARTSHQQALEIDLNQPIEDSFILIDQRLIERDILVRRHLEPNLPQVMGDPNRLEQVFLNLISNAEYALHEMAGRVSRGEIERSNYQKILTVSTFVEGNTVVAQVRDNGCGIPPSHHERIFEPFFTTKPVGEGTGLGLSISYGIVKELGGEITFESKENEGTTFTLRFPAVENGASKSAGSTGRQPGRPAHRGDQE